MHAVRVRLVGVTALSWAVVKSRKSAGIRRNLHRGWYFDDAPGFVAIGFARRVFADCAEAARVILVFFLGVRVSQS